MALELGAPGGLDIRVLPDRGLDIGAVTHEDVQLAWLSERGEAPALPVEDLSGETWRTAWIGGLLTTCGLHNVGAPSEGHGLHGTYSHRRAMQVHVEEGAGRTAVRGVVTDGSLVLTRVIELHHGVPKLTVEDTTVNRGDRPVAAPLLYHVNLGPPVWQPDAHLAMEPEAREPPTPRDAPSAAALTSWSIAPAHDADAPERLFEHHPVSGPDGWSRAIVTNRAAGLAVIVAWDTTGLPRVHQWVDASLGALAIEPANCSVLGRAADRAAGRLPTLAPWQPRRTRIRVTVTRPTASG